MFPFPGIASQDLNSNHHKRKFEESPKTAQTDSQRIVDSIWQNAAATLARMDKAYIPLERPPQNESPDNSSSQQPATEKSIDDFVASLLNDPDASSTIEEPNYFTALQGSRLGGSLPQKSPLELFQKILQPTLYPNKGTEESCETSAQQTPYVERSSESSSSPPLRPSRSNKPLHSPIICAIDFIPIAGGKEILKIVAKENGMFLFTNSMPKVIFEYNLKTKHFDQYCIDCEDIFYSSGWLIANYSKRKIHLYKHGETLSYSHSLQGKQILPDCKSITAIAISQGDIAVGFNGGTLGFFDIQGINQPSVYSFADKKLHIKDIVLNENFTIVRSSTRIFYSTRSCLNFLHLTTFKQPIEKMALHNSLLYVSSNGMIWIYDLLESSKSPIEINISTNHPVIGLIPDNNGLYVITTKKFIHISKHSATKDILTFNENSFTSTATKDSLIFLGTQSGDVLLFSITPCD